MWARLLIRFMRLAVRTGYRAAAPPPRSVMWLHMQDGAVASTPALPAGLAARRDFVCLPTYLERCGIADHVAAARRGVEQVCALDRHHGRAEAVLIVALQAAPAAVAQAWERAGAILRAMPAEMRGSVCVALIGGLGKAAALTICMRALAAPAAQPRHVGWLDDDIRFDPDAFAHLARHLEAHPACDVAGASKIAVANHHAAASLLHRLKRVARTSSHVHPHGCGLLVRWPAIAAGIPEPFTSDDGYLAMAMFDEGHAEPYRRMAVVPQALCWHIVGGPAGQVWRRIHRTIYENILLLAYFSETKSVRFFRVAIAHGLTPVPKTLVAALNVLLKLLLVGLYIRAATMLLCRGLVGRPMRGVDWSSYSGLNVPGRDT